MYDDAINGEEVSKASAAIEKLLSTKLGINTENVENLCSSVEDLAMVLSEDLSEASNIVNAKVSATDYLTNTIEFIRSQPGLENIETEPSLRKNPIYVKFFVAFNKIVGDIKIIRINPKPAEEFLNQASARDYARFIVELSNLARRIKTV